MPKQLNVLILEDNSADAELLLIELRRAGYKPDYQIVDNEKDFAAHLKPDLDLILSDYSLPQFNGIEALQIRNESGYNIPFIIVSGTIGEEIAIESIRQGADDYLMKDRMKRLVSSVENAIKQKELRDEQKQAQQEIELLATLSRQATTETKLDKLLFFITDQIVEVIPPAEAASIFLYDEKRKVVRVQAWTGFNDSEIEGLEFSIDSRQVGRLFQTKKPSLIKDVSKDPDFELIDKPSLKITISQIAVPLIYKKSIIGIIFADNLTRTDAFSQKNLDLLESIGNQLAGVIENARLLENIRHSRERYQSVTDDSPGLIDRFLPDGTITFVNQECCRFFGKTYDELIGANIQSSIPEEDRENVMSNIASLNIESPIQTFENKVIRHDGEVRWMRWTDRALFDDKGQKISIQSFGEDITESKKAEEKEQKHYKNMAFLSKTAMQFVDFPPEKNIYHFIGERLRELAGESIVAVNSIDHAKGILTTRAVIGMGKYTKEIMKFIGSNPEGMEQDANEENLTYLSDGELHDRKGGLYRIFRGLVPKPACRAIEKLFHLNKIYTMGFVKNARLFGSLAIFLPQGYELKNKATIKLFIEQASIAIQHKQAEEKLKISEERFRVFMEHVPAFAYILDKDFRHIYGNPASIAIDGYSTLEEYIGTSIKNIYSDEISNEVENTNRQVIDEECVVRHEFTAMMRDGKEHALLDIKFPIPLPDGKLQIGGLAIDITEGKQAEQALRESEEQYRNLFNSMLNGFALHEMIYNDAGKPIDYRFIEVNPAFEKLTGLRGKDIIGKTVLEVMPQTESHWIETYGKVALTGEPVLFEQVAQELNKHFEVVAFSPKKDRFTTIISDVTERKIFTRELQRERDKAQKYLDIAEVIIVALNKEGEITLVNQKGAGILGYQIEDLIGKNWFDTCLPAADRVRAKKMFNEFMASGVGLGEQFEQTIITKSGEERIIDWHSTPLWEWGDEDKHRIGSLSSGEDITRRKRAEHLLNALNQASVSMGTALTHEDIFAAIEKELRQLGFSCIFFAIDKTHSSLFPQYASSVYAASLKMAGKLVGIKRKDFLMPIDSVDEYKMVVREKKTLFIENSDEIVRQTLPKFAKKFSGQIIKIMGVPRNIPTPLIVEDKVIGVFSVYSNDLTQNDIPVITAFTHQLAGAWNKAKLLQNLRKTVEGTIHTVAATVETRDPYTAGHQTRVSDLAAAIAIEMKLTDEQVEGIKMAGVIHDLGKIKVPAEILSKPGTLSELEYKIIQTHPQVGFDLLKEIEFPWPIAEMVHQHHEKMDGSGYPQGLKGEKIMLEARILAVADIVEAMSSHRPYRPAHGIEKALNQIKKDKGTLLDPDVVDVCLKIFKEGYQLLEN